MRWWHCLLNGHTFGRWPISRDACWLEKTDTYGNRVIYKCLECGKKKIVFEKVRSL